AERVQVPGDELVRVGVGAGVDDEEPHLEVRGACCDVRHRVLGEQVLDEVRTSVPWARTASAVASSASSFRAISTRFRPARASWCANSAPTASDPPAITAQGPYVERSVVVESPRVPVIR